MHAFIPMGSEVNTLPFLHNWIEMGHILVTPKTLEDRQLMHLRTTDLDHLEPGLFHTYHAIGNQEHNGPYDIILVPGLGFSKNLYRLGYGGGYYDVFLSEQPRALKIGVGYPGQLCDTLPVENHDIRLDLLILGDRMIKASVRSTMV